MAIKTKLASASRRIFFLPFLAAGLTALFGLASCDENGAEEAGEQLEEAGEELEEGVEEVGDELEDATDK